MTPFNIKFQAYIPKNLGEPLLSYFKNDPRFHPDRMTNYEGFRGELTSLNVISHYWLPEPVFGPLIDTYCAIDNDIFHRRGRHSTNHSARLVVDLCIEPSKIGEYSILDKHRFLRHKGHGDNITGIMGNQHFDNSHRVRAYIRPAKRHIATPTSGPVPLKYEGVCNLVQTKRAEETPLDVKVRNEKSDTMGYHNTKVSDTTIFDISASGGYPFFPKWMVANIDFDFAIRVHLDKRNNTVNIMVNGKHDMFPAYELLVDDSVIYAHAASGGFAGLASSQRTFQAYHLKRVHGMWERAF